MNHLASEPRPALTEALVRGWVECFDLETRSIDDFESRDFEWAFSAVGEQYSTVIAKRRVDFDYLAIQATVVIAEHHREVLRELEPEARDLFLRELRLFLHARQIGYHLAFSPDSTEDPESLNIGAHLIDEQVTRAGYFEKNRVVQDGASVVALMFQKMADRRCWP